MQRSRITPSRLRRSGALAAVACLATGVSSVAMATTAVAADPASSSGDAAGVAEQLIVAYEPSADVAATESAALDVAEATIAADVEMLGETALGAQVLGTPSDLTAAETDALIAQLEQLDGVAYVEPDAVMTVQTNDPQYGPLWGLHGTNGMDVPEAWSTTRGDGAVVAVLDTGITAHPDLDANVLPGYDFVSNASAARDGNGRDGNPADQGDWYAANECAPNTAARASTWHGSHVAGTVAAVADNAVGVAGVAPEAQIVPVRVLARCGGSTSDIADAIVWASGGSVPGVPANANPADVINLSLGGPGTCSRTTQGAIDRAVAAGTTVVVAAGNSNVNASGFAPANCANVITVAASDIGGSRAFYSNYGATVEVTAPGGETAVQSQGILSTVNTSRTSPGAPGYAYSQGTSMAAPHVSGVAALLSQSEPSLTPAQILQRLQATATPLPGACSGGCGAGLVNAAAAVG